MAWAQSMRYATLTSAQVERMKALEMENEQLKDELAEKRSIILKYEGQGTGGGGGGAGQVGATATGGPRDEDGEEGVIGSLADVRARPQQHVPGSR